MATAIAITGKSGSGKTTLTKLILTTLHNQHPDKSILLIDNDLSAELGYMFGLDIKDTVSDIRSGKYKYKTGLPQNMPKQEFIEWALQDIIVNLYDDIDILLSGFVSSKNCTCFAARQINDALVKLIKTYDIVIFDCEYNLEYLNQFVDFPIDVTLIVSDTSVTSAYSSIKIHTSSMKIAAPGQIGLVLNKVKNRKIPENISRMFIEYDLDILGILPYDKQLEADDNLAKESEILLEAAEELLFRLNLPPFHKN